MTRSKTELLAELQELDPGTAYHEEYTSEQLKDVLRDLKGQCKGIPQIAPMKAVDSKDKIVWRKGHPPDLSGISHLFNDNYVLEEKFDGVRVLLHILKDGVHLTTGRRSDVTFGYTDRIDNFPALRALPLVYEPCVLDCELVAPAYEGQKNRLGDSVALVNSLPNHAIKLQQSWGLPYLYVFDCLTPDMDVPWSWRRLNAANATMQYSQHYNRLMLSITHDVQSEVIHGFLEDGAEGVMIKSRTGLYQPGKRSKDWIKVKRFSTGDFLVTDYIPGKGRHIGKVGALVVGYATESSIMEVARVGNLTDEMRDELSEPTGELKPKYYNQVAEVMAQGKTADGRLRHPHFVRWRMDKEAGEKDTGPDQMDSFYDC